MNEDDFVTLAGRVAFLETVLSDVMLNVLMSARDPDAALAMVREKTLHKIRYHSRLKPGSTEADSGVAMLVIAESASTAERFFDTLGSEIQRLTG